MKILLLDIETSPITCYTWGLWKQTITTDKIIDSGGVLCWSAKWLGEKAIEFDSIHQSSHKAMLKRIHKLLDEADVVVSYFGSNFDIPTLNKEFAMVEMTPPAPYKHVDLCKVVQKQFRFASSKLDYVCKALKLGAKVRHTGFEMWVSCMAGDDDAWRLMEKYNKQDVGILEKLYERLLPWIPGHPNRAAHGDDPECCPRCGSPDYCRRGVQINTTLSYRRYICRKCGGWFRKVFAERSHGRALVTPIANG